MHIVVDKDYVCGASSVSIRKLCKEHTVIFLETLLYELLTTEPHESAMCFSKFPDTKNAVVIIPCAGPLLRYEMAYHKAACPLIDHRLKMDFPFDPVVSTGSLSSQQTAMLSQWQQEIQREVETFHQVATGISVWCPDLITVSGNALSDACENLKEQAAHNPGVVRGIYKSLRLTEFPPASVLDESWVLFRWFQSHLLFSLDYIKRYGFSELNKIPKRIEHDIHDIQYAAFSALAGALASDDKCLISNFKLMCPRGKVISKDD